LPGLLGWRAPMATLMVWSTTEAPQCFWWGMLGNGLVVAHIAETFKQLSQAQPKPQGAQDHTYLPPLVR